MVTIRDEAISDLSAREVLLDAAFGLDRDLKPSQRLREGRLAARGLSLIAEHDGAVIGSVRLWNVAAGSAGEGLLLGPLAVDERHRGLGVGARLMREALWRAGLAFHRFVLLVGDAPYYERFGFTRAPATLAMPGPTDPARFLGFAFEPGALGGALGLVRATGIRTATRVGVGGGTMSSRDRRGALMPLAQPGQAAA